MFFWRLLSPRLPTVLVTEAAALPNVSVKSVTALLCVSLVYMHSMNISAWIFYGVGPTDPSCQVLPLISVVRLHKKRSVDLKTDRLVCGCWITSRSTFLVGFSHVSLIIKLTFFQWLTATCRSCVLIFALFMLLQLQWAACVSAGRLHSWVTSSGCNQNGDFWNL